MFIEDICPIDQKRSKVVSKDFAFALYNKEIREFGICKGEEFEDFEAKVLPHLYKRAVARLLYILKDRDKTEYELRQKLKEGYYPKEVIDKAIAYIKKHSYIDDKRYARNFIEIKKDRYSIRELRMKLRQKGISLEVLDDILEEYDFDEVSQIVKLLERKGFLKKQSDIREKNKVIQSILRKGYAYSAIKEAMAELSSCN